MERQFQYHILYKTTCAITGNFYIGAHSAPNLEDGYLGSGKRLRYSIQKHGKENHVRETLETFFTREELMKREREVVNDEILQNMQCMNLAKGGDGGHISIEAARAGAIRMNERIWSDPVFREKKSSESSARNVILHKQGVLKSPSKVGTVQSEKWKKMISEHNKIAQKGEKNSQFGKVWITDGNTSVKISKTELDTYLVNGWRKGRKHTWK